MTKNDNSFSSDLAQIRKRQLELIDEVNSIKEQYAGDEQEDIERIKESATKTLAEIDEIRSRQETNDAQDDEESGGGFF